MKQLFLLLLLWPAVLLAKTPTPTPEPTPDTIILFANGTVLPDEGATSYFYLYKVDPKVISIDTFLSWFNGLTLRMNPGHDDKFKAIIEFRDKNLTKDYLDSRMLSFIQQGTIEYLGTDLTAHQKDKYNVRLITKDKVKLHQRVMTVKKYRRGVKDGTIDKTKTRVKPIDKRIKPEAN